MPPTAEEIYPFVEKPARYLGGETGAAPPPGPGELRFVLCYPDIYEIGMSHKGLLNLYAALARVEGVAPERCFAPWPDMTTALRRRRLPLTSLESGLPLGEAGVIGFSFATPLGFTTALAMLDLAGVALKATDRGPKDPYVIAGGQATFNAEPMAEFLDAAVIGEGEEVVVEIAEVVGDTRRRALPRGETLERLAALEGVYVPSLYEATYDGGVFAGLRNACGAPARIRKRVVSDFGALAAPPVANVPPTHDRLAVEVMRGCLWGCRFCQAGMVTRPPRERDAASFLAEMEAAVRLAGVAELSFLALNACDYSALPSLIERIRSARPDLKLTLPAARVGSYKAAYAEVLIARKRNQQTFAPEVASDRLRRVINKGFTNDDVVATVRAAADAGCQNVKLYFMTGLPTEADEDASAIGELITACRSALRDGLGRWGNLSAAVAPFVPQSHTPFQWLGMAPAETLRRRIALARAAAPRQAKVDGSVGARVLEAALARGDRRLGAVIRDAYGRGARFDAWGDQYRPAIWDAAFAGAGLSAAACAESEIDAAAPLPWDHIDAGVAKEYLAAELRRALAGEITGPCAGEACRRCGACADGATLRVVPPPALPPLVASTRKDSAAISQRMRFVYAKDGGWRWLSHFELWRLMAAQLRRAGAPLARSGGYSPRARLVLAPALAVGVAGREEYADVYLHEPLTPEEFLARVAAEGPFVIARAWEVAPAAPSLEVTLTGARYEVELGPLAAALGREPAALAAAVTERLASGNLAVQTRRGQVDITPAYKLISWDRETSEITFDLATSAGAAARDVVAHLTDVATNEVRAARITRARVYGVESP